MIRRVPQPPIDREHREPEIHDFWTGGVIVIIGIILMVSAGRHWTKVETLNQTPAHETQLIKAFSTGGLKFASHDADAPPPKVEDPAQAAEALEKWAQKRAKSTAATWKVRVDTDAKTPCPT